MIYFIQDTRTFEIKIGYSANGAAGRLSALQTGNPGELKVLAEHEGDFAREKELHRQFATIRTNGEWFKPSPELLGFLMESKREEGWFDGIGAGVRMQRDTEEMVSEKRDEESKNSYHPSFNWLPDDKSWGGKVADNQLRGSKAILCPECGDTNNVPGKPRELIGFNSKEDLEVMGHTIIDRWFGNGDGVAIPMICEGGGHAWTLCVGFHKGESFMFAVDKGFILEGEVMDGHLVTTV